MVVAETSGFDWLTFGLAAYAAVVSSVAVYVTVALWRRSGPRLRVLIGTDVRIGAMRVTVSNVGRLPIQIRWVEVVGTRRDGQRVAMIAEETYGTRRKWPFTLDAHSTEEWVAADWSKFVRENDVVGPAEAVVQTGTGEVVTSKHPGRVRMWWRRRRSRR